LGEEPAGQAVHVPAPVFAMYCPAGQTWQEEQPREPQ
jgi:hypothetical protein